MNEIICPNCKKAFKIDESGYADIVKQVRDKELEKELRKQEESFQAAKEQAVELAKANTRNTLQGDLAKKDTEIAELRARIEANAVELREKEGAVELAKATTKNELQDEIAEKSAEISELKALVESSTVKQELAVAEAVAKLEKEKNELAIEVKTKEAERTSLEASLKAQYAEQLKMKDEVIERYKDMKTRMSTKMVGESLEQHCETEFNRLRATGFQKAYFEKDNDIRTGSKGDFIFRDFDDEGNEFISIMFEMKNEMDTTATKKKNEDFLKELDKDRQEKHCEYAVLVSLLEEESELYNSGIVDVSYQYPKMYVVRPQFFIPIITLLRNAAENSMAYRSELARVKGQNIDITNFEESLDTFKEGFARNYNLASRKFQDAINDIDKTIKVLEKIKSELTGSENNLRLANSKAEDLTIKRLTKNNPTMKAKFDELKADGKEG